jgi:heat shock protein HspQ
MAELLSQSEPARQRTAKYAIGTVVKHRVYPFRGVVFDIDPVFNNTEEWWNAIPEEVRPSRDQPFYHLLAENAETEYVAYVSEQNLVPDASNDPLRHPQIGEIFVKTRDGKLKPRGINMH